MEEDGFLSGQTGWDAELVNPMPVKVVCEEKVEDIFQSILEAGNENLCILNYYADSEAYRSFLREELLERVRVFGITEEDKKSDFRFECYFKELLKD